MNAPARLDLNAKRLPAEQARYAAWLDSTSRLGLLVLVVGYLAYVFGLVEPHVPLARLPELWSHPAQAFKAMTGHPSGWEWLALLHKGDILNLLGIGVLAGGSLLCLLAIIPLYARRGEKVYVMVCCLQILVLVLAASGQLTAGH